MYTSLASTPSSSFSSLKENTIFTPCPIIHLSLWAPLARSIAMHQVTDDSWLFTTNTWVVKPAEHNKIKQKKGVYWLTESSDKSHPESGLSKNYKAEMLYIKSPYSEHSEHLEFVSSWWIVTTRLISGSMVCCVNHVTIYSVSLDDHICQIIKNLTFFSCSLLASYWWLTVCRKSCAAKQRWVYTDI